MCVDQSLWLLWCVFIKFSVFGVMFSAFLIKVCVCLFFIPSLLCVFSRFVHFGQV